MVQQTLDGQELFQGRRKVFRDPQRLKFALGSVIALTCLSLALLAYGVLRYWRGGPDVSDLGPPFYFLLSSQALVNLAMYVKGDFILENGTIRTGLGRQAVAIDSNLRICKWPILNSKQIDWEFRSGDVRFLIRNNIEGIDELVEQIKQHMPDPFPRFPPG